MLEGTMLYASCGIRLETWALKPQVSSFSSLDPVWVGAQLEGLSCKPTVSLAKSG